MPIVEVRQFEVGPGRDMAEARGHGRSLRVARTDEIEVRVGTTHARAGTRDERGARRVVQAIACLGRLPGPAQAPSVETISAPSGVSGVQPVPNCGQAVGLIRPVITRPQAQPSGSATGRDAAP